MERDVSDRDQFGRLLRYVIDPEGEDAGGLLIDGGHAIARAYPPDTARDAEYRERQLRAQEAGLGLWARDACGEALASFDPTAIRIEVHPDAAGDDSLNLNDEWVRITNQGDQHLDVEGWTLRDESSSHRYRFGALVLPPGGSVSVRSGCGTDTDLERYWCVSGSAIWNNGGDTVLLLDPVGNVVAQLGYP
jgi:micrococcal nuclease